MTSLRAELKWLRAGPHARLRGDGHCQSGLTALQEQDLCHPPPEMYAMSEGEECPPTARDGVLGDGETVQRTRRSVLVSGNAEVVPMSFENDHCEEEEEVLGEGASEVEPLDSMTEDNEEAAIDVPVPRPGITQGALESFG